MSAEEGRRRNPLWKGVLASYLQTTTAADAAAAAVDAEMAESFGSKYCRGEIEAAATTGAATSPSPAPQQPRHKVRACSVLPPDKKCTPCARSFRTGARARHACQVRATPRHTAPHRSAPHRCPRAHRSARRVAGGRGRGLPAARPVPTADPPARAPCPPSLRRRGARSTSMGWQRRDRCRRRRLWAGASATCTVGTNTAGKSLVRCVPPPPSRLACHHAAPCRHAAMPPHAAGAPA